jgi:hypothetical protein
MAAMPCTTVQKMIRGMTILIASEVPLHVPLETT